MTAKGRYAILLWTIALVCSNSAAIAQISFSNIAGLGADASNVGSNKDGGCAFADYDLDGDLDLLVNTYVDNATNRSFLLRNDNGVYVDVTGSVAPGLKTYMTERCAVWGDCNNDGYPDFIVNTHSRITVYRNDAGTGFTMIANITGMTDGQNAEGIGWLDYDNDGDMDFLVECHNFGIDLFQNNGATPTPTFTQITINSIGPAGSGAGGTGLPEGGSTTGDYAASSDVNMDGYQDIIARRENTGPSSGLDLNSYDMFINQGNGTFAPNTAFNEQTLNGNKGGVETADFDNDGDLDLLWTSASTSANLPVVYEQLGINSGTFNLLPNPFFLDNNSPDANITYDGCTIGDIDNDGDEDIFMTANSGTGTLFLNNSTGPGNFQFRQPGPISMPGAALNYGVNVAGNGEGCVFVDYDNDGDLDLYLNKNGAANQLWQNDYIGSATEAAATFQNSYLRVIPRIDIGSGIFRDATNALVWLTDCYGTRITGIKEVGGGNGHGTQKTPWLHFGLANGPDVPYTIVVQFPRNGTTLTTVSRVVIPSQQPTKIFGTTLDQEQTVVIDDTDASDFYYCTDTDGDQIFDYADLDDDNDGIPDIDENTATSTSFQPPCNTTVLDFTGPPVLVTGGDLLEGATYKYTGVNGTIDALVSIEETFNTTVPTIDNNAADANLFKPQSAFNLANVGDQAYTEFKFRFVTGVAETPVVIPELFMNFNDIDGNANYSEENWASYPVSYSVDNPTQLTMTVNDWILGSGSTVDMPGSSNIAPDVNFTVRYLNISDLSIRVGAFARVAGASNAGRQHSIEFACVSNYIDPVTYYIDFDEDGIINMLDLDSDNDGIYDLFEAGHGEIDADNDGIIDGLASSFGANGLFDNVETIADNGILNYVIADSDSDGNIDAQELDSDNDGCFDVFEAGFTDANSDGELGPIPLTVDPITGIVTSGGP